MEKNRSTKIVAIAALFIAVIGLSIGFAAFSSTLTISQSAEVKPADTSWDIRLSSSSSDFATNTVAGYNGATALSAISDQSNVLSANAATITTSQGGSTSDTISGLKAHFTEPGQTVTYTFYVVNGGAYDAYLKGVTFAAAANAENNETVVCTPAQTGGGSAGLVASACTGISYEISINSVSYSSATAGTTTVNSGTAIGKMTGSTKFSHTVVVTITYANDAARADGAFDIAFGDITLNYDAVAY